MNNPLSEQPTLDCQRCGNILMALTPIEAQKVAEKPYNFMFYCRSCQREIVKELKDLMG